MVRARNPRSPGRCRDYLWIPAATNAGGFKARHCAAGSGRMGSQSELPGFSPHGTGRILRLGRHHNLRLLRSLKASDFSKSAFHPEMQREITVADLVERMGGHGADHLRQIEEL